MTLNGLSIIANRISDDLITVSIESELGKSKLGIHFGANNFTIRELIKELQATLPEYQDKAYEESHANNT